MKYNRKYQTQAYIFILLIALIFLLPLYWLVVSSIKPDIDILKNPPSFVPLKITFEHYVNAWKRLDYIRTFMNSFIVSSVTTALIILFSTMAGYVMSKKQFAGKKMMLSTVIATMIVPPTVLILPNFFIIDRLGMSDSLIGLILPFGVTSFGIFFMKQYMDDVPTSIIESARIDGCGDFKILFKIIFPLIIPGVATLGLIEFVNNWNSFVMPLVLLKTESKFVLPLKLAALSTATDVPSWGLILAGNVLTIMPIVILFLLLQKFFIKGIMDGAVKE
jgi:ABC-type glycerol-3-phosphate transport system permease component